MRIQLKGMPIMLLALVIGFFFHGSCSGFQKEEEKSVVREYFDVSYYSGKEADSIKHKLNLFVPEGIENPPMLLWIHGGAWAFGGRKFETDLARKFASEGVAVAAISYRLSPGIWKDPRFNDGVQHPEHIKDVARAFAWVYDHATKYGYDQNSIFVSGYSAGGHLAALLAMDPTYLSNEGRSVRNIRGAIPIAGAYDIAAYHESHLRYNGKDMAEKHVQAVFGKTVDDFQKASPTTYIENQWIPMLVISERGTYDYTKLLEEAAIKSDYDRMEFYHVRDMDHSELLDDLSKSETSSNRKLIVNYINKNKVDHSFLKKQDVKLAYQLFGEGEPLFVLNGGPGFSSHNFKGLAKKFSKNHQVILFDQRGTGFSKMPKINKETMTLDLMVEDMEDLRKHLGYDQISLFGQSFGGMYAMAYAAKYPQNVKCMILSHSGGMNLDFLDDVNQRLNAGLSDYDQDLLADASNIKNVDLQTKQRHKALAPGYLFNKENKNAVFKGLAFRSQFYSDINGLIWADLRKNPYDLSSKMKLFTKPVLILHGDNDIVHPKYAEYAHTIFPNSTLKLLKNCAHYGWLDAPKDYFAAIEAFLSLKS
ncbi:alpha/beta hydrolase [Flagellimonas sp. S3867]|uniref:alpha/beta hydrolase n=1 Tax=Flagellimonas sp. S3867 TaxID=2768063 RepID=UPI001685BCD1|nr:alpha/beta hydrolase [Flagellimonas sp. S3867]